MIDKEKNLEHVGCPQPENPTTLNEYKLGQAFDSVSEKKTEESRINFDDQRPLILEKEIILETFRWLTVMAAMLVCLAHGSNDVANAISPLIVVTTVDKGDETVPFYIGASGISLGLLLLGFKVMETVGKDVVKLDFVMAYCA